MCFNISCYADAHTAHSTEVKQTLYAVQYVPYIEPILCNTCFSFQGGVGNDISLRSNNRT